MSERVNFLGRLLRRAHLIASRRYRRYLAEFDFSPGEARLLIAAVEQPGLTASNLAARAEVDPPTATGVLDRLVARGLLRREPDPRDRRRLLLFPTVAGEALRPRIEAARHATQAELERLLGPEETARLSDLLQRFLEADARAEVARESSV